MNGPAIPAFLLKPSIDADPALPPHARIGSFEVRRLLTRGAATAVYLATDHALAMPVAVQEFLPARLVHRSADGRLHSADPRHDEALARGLQAFIGEARMLARCDHPALVRVLHLFEANGTAYRVMPHYHGQRLLDLRRQMEGAPDEASLRALLDALLGALETIHRSGQAHGGVSPSNILLLSDDRPLLLGPGAAAAATGRDLVDTLMAGVTAARAAADPAADDDATLAAASVGADLYALADVMRYCISGELLPPAGVGQAPEPLAATIRRRFEALDRPHYSATLLDALDAAASPLASERPVSAVQFRSWIDGTAAHARRFRAAPTTAPAPATAPATAAPPAATPAGFRTGSEPAWNNGDEGFESAAHGAPVGSGIRPPRAAAADPSSASALAAGRRGGWRQWVFVGGLTVLAAGVIAVATGAWDVMPALPVDRPATEARNPFAAAMPPAPTRNGATSNPSAANAIAPALTALRAELPAEARPASTATPAPEAAPLPEATMAKAEPAPLGTDPSPAEGGAEPSPPLAVAPSAVPKGAGAKASASGPSRSRSQAPNAARNSALAKGGAVADPRAACSGKTEFALYRCMQAQCRSAHWQAHPQCVRLRRVDEVG